MPELDGKVALVTGATRSIGEFIARGLHTAGAKVVITGVEDDKGRAVADSLGEGAIYRRLDVEQDDQIDSCLEECAARFGRLDFVINCACSYLDQGLATSRADWLKSLNVNVVGAAIVVQKAIPLWRSQAASSSTSAASRENTAPVSAALIRPARQRSCISPVCRRRRSVRRASVA
jgi:3-oxoacyl-[acyl-carrier protein] reductase